MSIFYRIQTVLLLALSLITTAFAQDTSTDSYTYTQDKLGVMVASDHPEFKIQLKSNASTGYSWFLRGYDRNLIQPVKHEFLAPTDKNLIGAPGNEVWTFNVMPAGFAVPQQTLLTMVYARPWEGDKHATQLVYTVSTISAPSVSHPQK